MPIIDITLVEGNSEENKHRLMEKITEDTVEIIGSSPDTVRVIIREIPSIHFSVAGIPRSKGG